MENAKLGIAKLVEKYNKIKAENKIKNYNEAQTLSEFIEPLFSYLGWDIHNINNPNGKTIYKFLRTFRHSQECRNVVCE